jgi:catechol 2,3-dioxygenase-like lactoylglutathione lyase family enzyme
MATAFHHVHIKSKDPRTTVKWWAEMFGATILPEFEFGTILFTPVSLDGVKINITGHAEEEAVGMADPQPIPYFGLEHVGLQVDDLDAVLERFAEDDKEIYVRRPGPGGYEIAFVEAPDGVTLELLCMADGAA